jgi:hypothetical protein
LLANTASKDDQLARLLAAVSVQGIRQAQGDTVTVSQQATNLFNLNNQV